LDGVGSSFVEGVAGGDVVGDLGVCEDVDGDLCDFDVADDFGAGGGGDTGEDGVGATTEKLQHAVGVVGAGGLAQNVTVAHDAGVGAEDDERVFGPIE